MTSILSELRRPRLHKGAGVWVAFSGGLDSTVLLHRLQAAGLPLKALHVNHHLQASANHWVRHCQAACKALDVPLLVIDVVIDGNDPAGPEAAAREARYGAIRRMMKRGDVLATAHHQDDQAETVLLRLLRGTGVHGLAAMAELSDFPPGRIWRPLLGCSRQDLKDYAETHGQSWVEDPHNLDPRYSRSFLRGEIFSRLSQRWPGATSRIARAADHCREAMALLDEAAAEDLDRLSRDATLSVKGLLKLAPARRRNALRAWITGRGHEPPPAQALERLEREVLGVRPDAAPLLGVGDYEFRRYRDGLWLMERLPPPPGPGVIAWDGTRPLVLPAGCGTLRLRPAPRKTLDLQVRFPRGGERIKPAGSKSTRTLKKLFQEAGVPPWVRERTPLLLLDETLAAAGERWASTRMRAVLRRTGARVVWEHALPGDPRGPSTLARRAMGE